MISSPERIAANQANARRSTGPKTPEGKVASRANSLKHGLTGSGIVSPADDLARIAQVADRLREEYQPITEVGHAMIDRAAVMLVRLGRAGRHEVAMVADQVAAAIYDFNQARRDWADELFDHLEANPATICELERFPEGLDRLIEAWSALAGTEDWSADDLAKVAVLSVAGAEDPVTVRSHIPAQIQRLEALKAAIDLRPIERARQQAADLALFSDSPEAIHARRYDAAIERAYHLAIKTMHEAEPPRSAVELPETPQTPTPSPANGFVFARAAARPRGPARAGDQRSSGPRRAPCRPRQASRSQEAPGGSASRSDVDQSTEST